MAGNNSTPCIDIPCNTDESFIIVKVVVLLFIIITATLGNLLVVIAVLNERRMRTATNLLVLNLALLDLLTALFRLPPYLVNIIADRYVYGPIWCDVHSTIAGICFIGSIYTLMFISIFRYRIVCKSTRPTKRHALYVSLFVWLWSTFIAVWPVLGWSKNEFNPYEMACIPSWSEGISGVANGILEAVLDFLIPFGVIIYCYVTIHKYLKKKHAAIKAARSKRNKPRKRTLVTRTMGIVIVAFAICYAPWSLTVFVVLPLASISPHNLYLPPEFYFFTTILVFINSSINPIIYGFQMPQFRRQYARIVCPWRKVLSIAPMDTEKSSQQPRSNSESVTNKGNHKEFIPLYRKKTSIDATSGKRRKNYVFNNDNAIVPSDNQRTGDCDFSVNDSSAG